MRDKPSDILLVMGIALSLLLILNGNCIMRMGQDSGVSPILETADNVSDMQYIFWQYRKVFFFVSFAYGACNCCAVCFFWARRHIREMIIRYIYGYSVWQLLRCLFWQLVVDILAAGILVCLLQRIILHTGIWRIDSVSIELLVKSLLMCAGIFLILIACMLLLVHRVSPAKMLCKNRA